MLQREDDLSSAEFNHSEEESEPVVESFRDWLARVFPFLAGDR